jgi:hypothetical protein
MVNETEPEPCYYVIPIMRPDGSRIDSHCTVWEIDPEQRDHECIVLRLEGRELQASHEDVWWAFQELRRQLEAEGLLLCCYGADRYVYPSGMALDMGGGWRAERYDPAGLAARPVIIDIFDTAPDIVPVTIDQQEREHQAMMQRAQERRRL